MDSKLPLAAIFVALLAVVVSLLAGCAQENGEQGGSAPVRPPSPPPTFGKTCKAKTETGRNECNFTVDSVCCFELQAYYNNDVCVAELVHPSNASSNCKRLHTDYGVACNDTLSVISAASTRCNA